MHTFSNQRGSVRSSLAPVLTLGASSFLSVTTVAQDVAPEAVQVALRAPIDELLFDEPGDGALWARGTSYKANFDSRGSTIVPFFGSDAPRNYPLALRVRDVSLGDAALSVDVSTRPTRAGDLVSIDHRSFIEEYELALDSLEQRFVFPSLHGTGALVLHIAVDSELAGIDVGRTLRFENELGQIDYGAALALDAGGRTLALDSRLVDGAIELTVPADFVANATFPLTIDPLVTVFGLSTFANDEITPDVSYDVTTDRWCSVWTSVWSATDHDAFAKLVTGAGVPQANLLTIDFTLDKWEAPKIANDNATDRFLVCANVVPPSGASNIRGRLVFPGTATVGSTFPITPADGVLRNQADVGGNPHDGAPSYFGVTWLRSVSQVDNDVEFQLVNTDGSPQGTPTYLEHLPGVSESPSISNSTGRRDATNTPAWTIVWQERVSAINHDVLGAQVGWSGSVLHPRFPISVDAHDDTAPKASTVLDPVPFGPERPYMVVFQRAFGANGNIYAKLMRGTTELDAYDVTVNDGAPLNDDQSAPTVDSDGAQFLVGYIERATPASLDGNVWITDYYASNNKLIWRDNRRLFSSSPADEGDIALHSMAASGGPRQHYCGAWKFRTLSNGYDVIGGLWDGFAGGWILKFCNGDGSGVPCPCGNNGGDERGCANSANPLGAELSWTGDASLSADTFTLHASGMPANANCLFFQGTTAAGGGAGVPFGDGKRCALGAITRMALKTSVAGAATFPEQFDAPIGVAGQLSYWGETRYYQAWYRDTAPFCTSEPFNLTNGVSVIWAP